MQQFKAFRIHSDNGQIRSGFDNIGLDDLSPGDVVFKCVYSGINYKDALAATGKGAILRRYPLVGGIDAVGYIVSSGDPRFQIDDPVLVCGSELSETRDGGYAERVQVPGDILIPLPEGLSLYQAAAIGTAGFTAALAVQKLQLNGQVPDMGPIAVTGATGGVGSYAIDLLSGLGFEVVAITGKRERIPYLEALGASRVMLRQALSFGERPLERGLWGGAVDAVGGEMLSWLTRTVQPMGNIASIGLTGGIELKTTVMPFILRGINLLGINSVICPRAVKMGIWQRLATDMKPGHLDEIVSDEIAFSALPEKFDDYIRGRVCGRTVVKISE